MVTHMFHHVDANHWMGNVYTMITVGLSLDVGFFGTMFCVSRWRNGRSCFPSIRVDVFPQEQGGLDWLMKRVTGEKRATMVDRTFGMCGASAGVYALIGAEVAVLSRRIWGTLRRVNRTRKGSVWRLTSVAVGHVVNVGAQFFAMSSERVSMIGHAAHVGGFVFGVGVSRLFDLNKQVWLLCW
ncbi:hypothetical protein BC829DRAFT_401577 [Chytridium lagenaria]|nr:hypothetical protein BC829DRAFT_401577 [Chytridium lagenaria]